MHVGIGERSERVVAPPSAIIVESDGYDVVRQPDRPDYRFGNLLVLPRPPEADELDRWLRIWEREFPPGCGVDKVVMSSETMAADPPAGLAEAAAAVGLEVKIDEILSLGTPAAPAPPDGVTIRPVSDEEWQDAVDLCAEVDGEESFRRWRMGEWRRLIDAGRGAWWCAWREGAPVGGAGIFRHDGLARYQEVHVRPAHRRQGIAAALVGRMAAAHRAAHPRDSVIIVAERASSPERIYRRLGFDRVGSFANLIGDRPQRPA